MNIHGVWQPCFVRKIGQMYKTNVNLGNYQKLSKCLPQASKVKLFELFTDEYRQYEVANMLITQVEDRQLVLVIPTSSCSSPG